MANYQPPTYEATTPPVISGRRRRVSYNQRNPRIIHEVTTKLEQEVVEPEHPLWIKLMEIIRVLKTFSTITETFIFFTFIF